MKRKIYLVLGLAIGGLLLLVAVCAIPPEKPPMGFGVLRYTNESAGIYALVTITNAGESEYRLAYATRMKTNEIWREESNWSPSEVLPAQMVRTFKIQLPPGASTWRLECRLWKARTGLPKAVNGWCDDLGLPRLFPTRWKLTQPHHAVTSPEFRR